ncbi:MAG: hypothetical protein ABIJ22_02620 [Patescibacteria group bacterium]
MGLPKVFKSQKLVDKFYLAILLSNSSVQAALWQVNQDGISIIKKSTKRTYQGQDQAIVESDKILQELGKQSENVNEVVFGLAPTWVENQGVVTAKKPLLKSITQELDLNAVGFVIISEALARQLAVNNPRLTTLLVEFSQQELYLSLIDQGKLISTKFVGRSDQTIADMTEALARLIAHLEEEIKLPSKMLLNSLELNQAELKEQQQLLLEHDWVNSHPFVHPPTVEILDSDLALEAVVKQGGISVAGVLAEVKDSKPKPKIKKEPKIPQDPLITKKPELFLPDRSHKNKSNKLQSRIKMKIFSWFSYHKFFAIAGFISGFLALGVIGWIWLSTNIQAQVIMSLDTQTISNETTVILDPDIASSDTEKLILAATTIKNQTSGSQTKEATGTKLVGDKATGKVIIYNTTDGEKIFEKGTKLTKGDLAFTLDEEVKVASASVKEISGGESKEYGKTEANVTALNIGSDYNLSKETELQIASFDPGTYSATTIEAFTGGSSREIRVVSLGDKEELLEELTQKLIAKANKVMQAEMDNGCYLVETNMAQVDKKLFTAEIGDEVGSVTLDLELTAQALSYETKDLIPLAQKVLEAKIPQGYTLANSEPQILSAPDQEATKSGAVTLVVNITAQAKPDLNLDDLKQVILGKKINEAKQVLVANDAVNSVEVRFIPEFAIRFYPRMPKDPAKIEIQ